MVKRSINLVVVLLAVLSIALAACSPIPDDAKRAILESLHPDEEPRIQEARLVDPLPEEGDAEQVYCAIVAHLCFDGIRWQLIDCTSRRFARLVDGEWQVSTPMAGFELDTWEERGCPIE